MNVGQRFTPAIDGHHSEIIFIATFEWIQCYRTLLRRQASQCKRTASKSLPTNKWVDAEYVKISLHKEATDYD